MQLLKHDASDTADALRTLVYVKDRGARANRTRRHVEFRGHLRAEAANDVLGRRSDDPARGARHAKVGDISRPVRKHLLVRRGNVRMRAEHDRYPTVKAMRESQLFAGRLSVNI